MNPGLATDDLTFSYRAGAPPVVDRLSVEFPAGALTTITGPSGGGKSTLLYVVALLLKPSSGSVLWDGAPVESRSDAERARLRAARSGFVFQDAMLDPARTVVDNVCESALFAGMTSRDARERAQSLLDDLGVGHRADHRPGEISGGQAQRVALCRALVTDPDVIFGDEPTGNLDDESAAVVWRVLRDRASAGATVVVATHDRGLAATGDQQVRVG
ncbi:MAG: ATP-binding cassette domain-containing protein [Brevundimonas sp.]